MICDVVMISQRRNHHREKVLLLISRKPLKSIWLIKIWKSYLKSLGYFRKYLNPSKQTFPSGGQNFCSYPSHLDVCFFTPLSKVFNLLVALRQTLKMERQLMGPWGALQRWRIPQPGNPRWCVGQGQLPASPGVVGGTWGLCRRDVTAVLGEKPKQSALDRDRSSAEDEENQSSLL